MNRSRRTFLGTGALGAAALAAGGWLRYGAGMRGSGALDGDARDIVSAMVPAFLAGALPDDARRADAVRETVDAVVRTVAGLPPQAQTELAQLFALLALAPTRVAMTGPWQPWERASPADVDAMLRRWQSSRVDLLRSAYDGLHQLILAAWYGNARAWPAIGYPGPPAFP
jgi:hypothetical protein